MDRVVLDTNVWLSAILWRGAAYKLRLHAESNDFQVVTSMPILHELVRVLRFHFNLPDDLAYFWWLSLINLCDVIPIHSNLNVIERDPDDNKFIQCAVDGQCDYIISRDRDLLDLKRFEEIDIITVAQFLDYLEEAAS